MKEMLPFREKKRDGENFGIDFPESRKKREERREKKPLNGRP